MEIIVASHEAVLEVVVTGHAEPAGSKRAFVPSHGGRPARRADGSMMVNVVDANPKAKGWKVQVAQIVGEVWGDQPLLDGPVVVEMTFVRQRPKGHYGTGRNEGVLKDWARAEFPTTKPDTLKLARGVEDALTGVVWRDDAQIVDEVLRKRYGSPERVERRVAVADPAAALGSVVLVEDVDGQMALA